jgi:hypothetical protein
MAGGGNYILNKGYPVLKTYNTSFTSGVQRYRAVKLTVVSSAIRLDVNPTLATASIGVVQEDIDQVKVAYGNTVADVAIQGITKMYVAVAASIVIGAKIGVGGTINTATAGGAVVAVATNPCIGICVGMSVPNGTVNVGDFIDVLLTPGLVA